MVRHETAAGLLSARLGNLLVESASDNDNETIARASVNVFKVAGRPVALGYTRYVRRLPFAQSGDSFDVSLPLFNRTIGFEYVRQYKRADGTGGDPTIIGGPDDKSERLQCDAQSFAHQRA